MNRILVDTPVLKTERLVLRAPQPQDVTPWVDYNMSERAIWHGGGPKEGIGRAWRIVSILMGHWQIHGFGLFIVTDKRTQTPLAAVGPFFPANWPERELGWSIWSPEDEGRGLGAEAARAVIRHCFHDLGWPTLVSYINPRNTRSIALAERLGATLDPAAERVEPTDLVYRHPRPEVA